MQEELRNQDGDEQSESPDDPLRTTPQPEPEPEQPTASQHCHQKHASPLCPPADQMDRHGAGAPEERADKHDAKAEEAIRSSAGKVRQKEPNDKETGREKGDQNHQFPCSKRNKKKEQHTHSISSYGIYAKAIQRDILNFLLQAYPPII